MAVILSTAVPGFAADPDRDFSGKWTLDAGSSRLQALAMEIEPVLMVVQQDDAIRCSGNASFALDGSETRYRAGAETRSTAVKWEGSALLINTLVSGTQDFTIMDRWKLSADHATLTITRQVVRKTGEVEGTLVYRAQAYTAPAPAPAAGVEAVQPLAVRPESRPAPVASEFVVPEGTRIALALRNSVDTKHSREGDRVYLETVYPVARDGRIVIPRGSFVNGTVTISKPAGRVKGKGELYIRFDSLTLPNGVTRDFRSRLGSAEGKTVDRAEGKVSGESDKGHDARTVATTAGMGAGIGGLIGRAAGSTLKGVGVGGAAGAAAGLAGVMMKKGPDATLRQGTTLEMILDSDLRFTPDELR
jgi:type IV secretion system protein VirB10